MISDNLNLYTRRLVYLAGLRHLMEVAYKSDKFCKFPNEMSRGIVSNTLPGKEEVFLASKLVPLHRLDGSVRLIAVGDLIYRACAKAMLKATFKLEFLLPFQIGMMSPGGVELTVRELGEQLRVHWTATTYTFPI